MAIVPQIYQSYDITQLKLNSYRVHVGLPGKEARDISEFVTKIQWDYDLDQASERYTISVVNGEELRKYISTLQRVWIWGTYAHYNDLVPNFLLKEGIIMEIEISDQNRGDLTIYANDIGVYLVNNKGSHIFDNETPTQFIKRTAAMYGIPLGVVDNSTDVFTRKIFFNNTIYDMWVTALSYLRQKDPRNRFFIRAQGNTIDVAQKIDPPFIWLLESGSWSPEGLNRGNIFNASSRFSARNYRNMVKVYDRKSFSTDSDDLLTLVQSSANGGDPSPLAVALDQESIELYGLFSESVDIEDDMDISANAQEQADELLRRLIKIENTGTINTFNINSLRAGDPVFINEPTTGLIGKYYIKSGSHVVTDTEATMSLTVNIEDELPEAYKSRSEQQSDLLQGIFQNDPTIPQN